MDYGEAYREKLVTLREAAGRIQSGDFVGTGIAFGSCSPDMFDAILDRWEDLRDVTICDCVPVRPSRLYDLDTMVPLDGHVNYHPSFGTPTSRKILEPRFCDYFTAQSHDMGDRYGHWSDVFIAQCLPPNEQGWVNLGLTNFYTMEAIRTGRALGKQRLTIGEVNDRQPVVYGDNWLHISEFDLFYENPAPIANVSRATPGEKEKRIGQYVLDLIRDGDTIQMGIGQIPEAVVAGLDGKRDIGVHTEMFPVGLPQLVEKGVVTNARKPFQQGVTVATFCMGDQSMYDYVRENPSAQFYPVGYTNNPVFVARIPNMVAINMALLVDLSGQICSEGLGHRMVSGPGGAAGLSVRGLPFQGGKGRNAALFVAHPQRRHAGFPPSFPNCLPGLPLRCLATTLII